MAEILGLNGKKLNNPETEQTDAVAHNCHGTCILYTPKEDITSFELAQIVPYFAFGGLTKEALDDLDDGVSRHFELKPCDKCNTDH